jgi:hypothetical protein
MIRSALRARRREAFRKFRKAAERGAHRGIARTLGLR